MHRRPYPGGKYLTKGGGPTQSDLPQESLQFASSEIKKPNSKG